MQESLKQKTISQLFLFFFCILEVQRKLSFFEKDMTIIAYVFPKVRIARDVVR